jgi:YD repeat-containing protein
MVHRLDMRYIFTVILLLSCSFLRAQDTLHRTITVKKNAKKIKSITVYNYPKVNSKQKDAVRTEYSGFDENGHLFLHSNFYNNTNESYEYNDKGAQVSMKVYDIFLKTYMYQDTFLYDPNGLLVEKTRFIYNKLNAGRKDVKPVVPSDNIGYIPDGVLFRETYKYNEKGLLVHKSNDRGERHAFSDYRYDSLGNQVEERSSSCGKKDTLTVINITKYDDAGNAVAYATVNTRGETLRSSINKYDSKNRKTETDVFDAAFTMVQKFLFTYDEEGNMTEQKYYDYKSRSESKIMYDVAFWQ